MNTKRVNDHKRKYFQKQCNYLIIHHVRMIVLGHFSMLMRKINNKNKMRQELLACKNERLFVQKTSFACFIQELKRSFDLISFIK